LKKGKQNTLLEIAVRYLLFGKNIKKAKLNSVGVKKEYQGLTTVQLLCEVGKYVSETTRSKPILYGVIIKNQWL
jgi:hypothetical protein